MCWAESVSKLMAVTGCQIPTLYISRILWPSQVCLYIWVWLLLPFCVYRGQKNPSGKVFPPHPKTTAYWQFFSCSRKGNYNSFYYIHIQIYDLQGILRKVKKPRARISKMRKRSACVSREVSWCRSLGSKHLEESRGGNKCVVSGVGKLTILLETCLQPRRKILTQITPGRFSLKCKVHPK